MFLQSWEYYNQAIKNDNYAICELERAIKENWKIASSMMSYIGPKEEMVSTTRCANAKMYNRKLQHTYIT